MKKVFLMLLVLGLGMFQACEGPEGPPGLDGMDGLDGVDGEDGINLLSAVFEVQVTFDEENSYSAFFNISEIGVFDDDNFLAYIAWGFDEDGRPIWRMLPQSVLLEEGLLMYNFQYSTQLLGVFMEASFSRADLSEEWTDDQWIRFVYLPGIFAGEEARMDYSDYYGLMDYLGKGEEDVVDISPK